MRPRRPLGRRWRATRLHTTHRDVHHALPHTNTPESLAWACTGQERCPSVASHGAAQPLHAIRSSACSRLAFSAPSFLSTRGRRGVSAASSGARKPDAGRSPTTRLCGAGGGRAGRATPGGADAPHSKSTRSYEVVVVNELEVHVEAWRWHEGASMIAAITLGGAAPRAPRGDHAVACGRRAVDVGGGSGGRAAACLKCCICDHEGRHSSPGEGPRWFDGRRCGTRRDIGPTEGPLAKTRSPWLRRRRYEIAVVFFRNRHPPSCAPRRYNRQ